MIKVLNRSSKSGTIQPTRFYWKTPKKNISNQKQRTILIRPSSKTSSSVSKWRGRSTKANQQSWSSSMIIPKRSNRRFSSSRSKRGKGSSSRRKISPLRSVMRSRRPSGLSYSLSNHLNGSCWTIKNSHLTMTLSKSTSSLSSPASCWCKPSLTTYLIWDN